MDMTVEFRRDFDNAYTSYGERGRRLIGFAIYHIEALPTKKWTIEDIPLGDLNFLGMVAIMDPPRDDAAIAIAQCKVDMSLGMRTLIREFQAAGISVFMVTGDHQVTATAIARQIGLIGVETEVVVPAVVGHTGRDRKQSVIITRTEPPRRDALSPITDLRSAVASNTTTGQVISTPRKTSSTQRKISSTQRKMSGIVTRADYVRKRSRVSQTVGCFYVH
jgi:magnesium-transporting ATPase (P-type)